MATNQFGQRARQLFGTTRDRLLLKVYKYTCSYARKAYKVMQAEEYYQALNISSRYQFVFVSNPKTGCSSIQSACIELELRGADETVDCRDLRVCHDPRLSPLRRVTQIPSLAPISYLLARGYRFATFVRNPYDRLISCYGNKVVGGMEFKPRILAAMGFDPADLSRPISFEDFVRFVVKQDDYDMDPHWRPQSSQILYDVLPYVFIGRFENFRDDYFSFFSRLGVAQDEVPSFRHLNMSEVGKIKSRPEFYDKPLQDIVYERYKADFDNFGYSYNLNA